MNTLRTVTRTGALKICLKPIDFNIHSFCCHHSKLRVYHCIEMSAILWLNIWIWYSRVMLLRAHTNEWQIHSIAVVCFWSNLTTDLRDLSHVWKPSALITCVVALIMINVSPSWSVDTSQHAWQIEEKLCVCVCVCVCHLTTNVKHES